MRSSPTRPDGRRGYRPPPPDLAAGQEGRPGRAPCRPGVCGPALPMGVPPVRPSSGTRVTVAGWRARRVPGADYHEGQGGSQRRGTRWNMRCVRPCGARSVEFGPPPAARRLARSVTDSATASNGTRRDLPGLVSRWPGGRRVPPALAIPPIRRSRRLSPIVGLLECSAVPPRRHPPRATVHCVDAVMVGPAAPEVNDLRASRPAPRPAPRPGRGRAHPPRLAGGRVIHASDRAGTLAGWPGGRGG